MCMPVFIYSNSCVVFTSSVPSSMFDLVIMKDVLVE
jgi:hypothetical protein